MFDDDGANTVTVDEILRGVNSALNGCVAPLTPGDHRRTLVFDGHSRIYDIHILPGYDGGTAVPLVLDFHGFQLNATIQAGVSGWRSLADGADVPAWRAERRRGQRRPDHRGGERRAERVRRQPR